MDRIQQQDRVCIAYHNDGMIRNDGCLVATLLSCYCHILSSLQWRCTLAMAGFSFQVPVVEMYGV